MSDTPVPPKPIPSSAKLARQARLNAALRANLRRRKGPETVSDKPAEPELTPQPEAGEGDETANNAKL